MPDMASSTIASLNVSDASSQVNPNQTSSSAMPGSYPSSDTDDDVQTQGTPIHIQEICSEESAFIWVPHGGSHR